MRLRSAANSFVTLSAKHLDQLQAVQGDAWTHASTHSTGLDVVYASPRNRIDLPPFVRQLPERFRRANAVWRTRGVRRFSRVRFVTAAARAFRCSSWSDGFLIVNSSLPHWRVKMVPVVPRISARAFVVRFLRHRITRSVKCAQNCCERNRSTKVRSRRWTSLPARARVVLTEPICVGITNVMLWLLIFTWRCCRFSFL